MDARKKYNHLIIRDGIWEDLSNDVPTGEGEERTGKSLCLTWISKELLEESKAHMSFSWVYQIPYPNPGIQEHVHDYDEILFFMGSDGDNPMELNGEFNVYLEGEPYIINKTCLVYIPAGVRHCPIDYKKVDKPHLFISLSLAGRYNSDK